MKVINNEFDKAVEQCSGSGPLDQNPDPQRFPDPGGQKLPQK